MADGEPARGNETAAGPPADFEIQREGEVRNGGTAIHAPLEDEVAVESTRPRKGDGMRGDAKSDKKKKKKSRATMKGKAYMKELRKLQAELCRLQEWVKATGERVIIVFEGRDAAGKGGTIKAITERVSPRVFRLVALPAPSDREKTQIYMQRYIAHFPAAGEIVIFDRSWYNRAGVEYVLGFCTEGAAPPLPGHLSRSSRSRSWRAASGCSSTGSRSARRSRSGASRPASRTPCGSGSSAPRTSSPAGAGTTTPTPGT